MTPDELKTLCDDATLMAASLLLQLTAALREAAGEIERLQKTLEAVVARCNRLSEDLEAYRTLDEILTETNATTEEPPCREP